MTLIPAAVSHFETDFQTEKALVRQYHADLSAAAPEAVAEVLARYTTPDWLWRGMHPFHEQTGAEAVARAFWTPLKSAFTRLQRRPDCQH